MEADRFRGAFAFSSYTRRDIGPGHVRFHFAVPHIVCIGQASRRIVSRPMPVSPAAWQNRIGGKLQHVETGIGACNGTVCADSWCMICFLMASRDKNVKKLCTLDF